MNLIRLDDYLDVIDKNITLFKEIETICYKYGEPVEGNCFYEHVTFRKSFDLITKQMNHFILGKNHFNIAEIGFNAGHSSLLYLLSNSESKLTIFDICEHRYTIPCFEYLQKKFPNRLKMFVGNSTDTIPDFQRNNPEVRFDLIHIDGCHEKSVANEDFLNCKKMASDIIVFDDTHDKNLNDLFEEYLKLNLISEVHLYRTKLYEHRIGKI